MDSDKLEHKARLAAAVQWKLENPHEKAITAGRIFQVDANSVAVAIRRHARTVYKKAHGGYNKILSDTQNKAICSYCKEHYESGMGATKQMVFVVIGFLKAQEEPPKLPPL
jgi:hypothetical protein